MLVLLDSCQSGSVLRNGLTQHQNDCFSLKPRLTVISASCDQKAATEENGEGLFTKCLIEVLEEVQKGTEGMHAVKVAQEVECQMKKVQEAIGERIQLVPCHGTFPDYANDEQCRKYCFHFKTSPTS